MSESIFEQLDQSPVAYGTLLAYITMASLTGIVSPDSVALIEYGAAHGYLAPIEPWRILSHAYLHGGLIHLLFNSYALFLFGPALERELGSLRFALLYVVAAACGGIGALLVDGIKTFVVGGSGALFGMLGAIVALNMRHGRSLLEFAQHPGGKRILSMIAFNLLLSWMIPFISNSAHIGGLIGGFALTFCFLQRGKDKVVDRRSRLTQIGWILLFSGFCLYVLIPNSRIDYLMFQEQVSSFPEKERQSFIRGKWPIPLVDKIILHYNK